MEETKKTYCVSVDGSKFSHFGWEVTYNELYKKGDRIIVTHISNPDKEQIIPYEAQPKTLFLKYQTICLGKMKEGDFEVVVEPRKKEMVHALEGLIKVADSKKCDCIVMGFQGHKANIEKKELSKGLVYMIRHVSCPVFVIKENSLRKNKENGSFTWLFGLVNKYSRSYQAFENALTYIDLKRDKVKGVNFYHDGDGWDKKELETDFLTKCNNLKIKNVSFSYVENDRSITVGKQLNDIINFGDDYVDFIGLGHNASKYKNIDEAPTVEIIKFAQVNIFFSPMFKSS